MSKPHHFNRLNLLALAHGETQVGETTPLLDLERLALETHGLGLDAKVEWQARVELRPGSQAEQDVWMHLTAKASMPLTCQRCMGNVGVPLEIDQWYRFVATEAIAMAEDDEAEEDLLVMEPQFDVLAVLEDELLMALPLVPMHDECPVVPVMQVGEEALAKQEAIAVGENSENSPLEKKLNPFAVLAQLKKKSE